VSAATGAQAARIARVRLQDAPAQPWRNRGGVTRELLAWPHPLPGAAAEWRVRVSVAEIGADGPFSAFVGVSRGFAVLEGDGVVLSLPSGERRLTPADEALHFDGGLAPGCRLIGAPTRDLNLMVRQRDGRLHMRRACAGESWGQALVWRGLYTHGPASFDTGDGPVELPGGTLVWSDDAGASSWRLAQGSQAWWLGCAREGAP